ncbi:MULTISPECIES: TPM domain-containing protein [Burkholderia]|uniref:TPM domain-containing protein n=1 Tax=Burkholderia TaxID=32008 RepID=UPI00069DD8A3|nr:MULTISPECIES: TPM domain-containing protein [Burkholderia]
MAGTAAAIRNSGTIPVLQGRVTDSVGMFTETCKADLTRRLKDLEQRTGTQFAVLVVSSAAPQTIEQFSTAVFEKWKLGKKKVDNGILLVAAVKDHRVRIEVGYGLEGTIPDVVAGQIIRDRIVPAFRQHAFEAGLSDAVNDLVQRLGPPPQDRPTASEPSATNVPASASDAPAASISSVLGSSTEKHVSSAAPVFWVLLVLANLVFGAISEWRSYRWIVCLPSSYLGSSAALTIQLVKGAINSSGVSDAALLVLFMSAFAGIVPCLLGIGWFQAARNWMLGTDSGQSSASSHPSNQSTGSILGSIVDAGLGSSSDSSSNSSSSDSSIIDLFIGGGGSSGGGGASDSW